MEKKIKLNFDKKKTRPATLSIRLTDESAKKLKKLSDKFGVSQADIIEKLIELAE